MEHETKHAKKEIKMDKNNILIGTNVIMIILLVIAIVQLGSISLKLGPSLDEVNVKENTAIAKVADSPTPAQAAPSAKPIPAEPKVVKPSVDMANLIDDDTIKGDPNAPVTIVEWSDFECPFCTRFYDQTLPQIVDEYINTGKVKLIYRDFPLGFHTNAQKAAEAAECAGEQDSFWEMHDMLFEKGVSGGVSSFKQFAADLNLDTAKFDECLDSGVMASEVKKDLADGQAAGITGTPGFIINGELVSGAQPFSNFKQIIEAALAE